eukprot:CAMPEP_0181108812 /NCGR_PEP_ID=MMETSP1071-20121207/17833_1 /TAXON_ID=35127 /ORGANISM="Thalassiosira sp., Strain NH16" /LENGTH=111 /DNA_ID=CAMNT_0023192447 /DNA_START=581 /DNA_END=912 /DNA_ORIENTATION=-
MADVAGLRRRHVLRSWDMHPPHAVSEVTSWIGGMIPGGGDGGVVPMIPRAMDSASLSNCTMNTSSSSLAVSTGDICGEDGEDDGRCRCRRRMQAAIFPNKTTVVPDAFGTP